MTLRRLSREACLIGSCLPCLLVLLLAGCEDDGATDDFLGVAVYEETDGGVYPDGGFGEIEPVYGMHDRDRVEAYDFGPVNLDASGKAPIHPLHVFYDEAGDPLLTPNEDGTRLEGQGAIVETLLDQPDYSPFWELVVVTAPSGYRLDDLKSLASLEDAGFTRRETGVVLNCPIVEEAATLSRGLSERARSLPRLPLWYRGLKAFCFLVDRGWEVLQDPDAGLGLPLELPVQDLVYPVLDLYGEEVLAKDNRLFPALPGEPAYSPLVRVLTTRIDDEYTYGDIDAFGDVADAAPRTPAEVRNVPIRGLVPACGTNDDCASTATESDAPLTCNLDLRIRDPLEPTRPAFCDAPPVGFGQECGPGIARCDPFGGPVPLEGAAGQLRDLICVGLRAREKRFCYNACDPDEDDTDDDEHRDTRCGGVRDFQCYGLRRAKKPDGVCFKRCNSLATNRLVQQCQNPTAQTQPPPAAVDILCGNGAFDIGEACDPTAEPWDAETCNEGCALSTYGADPPVAAGDDEEPLECTNAGIDICIFPDARAQDEAP